MHKAIQFFLLSIFWLAYGFVAQAATLQGKTWATNEMVLCNNGTIEAFGTGGCPFGWSAGALGSGGNTGGSSLYTDLMNWNQAGITGTTWPQWSYYDGSTTSIPGLANTRGFTLTGTDPLVGAADPCSRFTEAPRMTDQTGGAYGSDTLAFFDETDYAPSATEGASLRLRSNNGTDNQVSWWAWTACTNFLEMGLADADTDRMDFYIKIDGMESLLPAVADGIWGFHVGTYLCDATVGNGCPVEGPGNNHYYHYFGFNPGLWIHAQMDRHPQHLRSDGPPDSNPSQGLYGSDSAGWVGYYANMMQFYVEVRRPQAQQTTVWIDEIRLSSTQDSAEPQQNEETVTSVWVGYDPNNDEWQISWVDSWRTGTTNAFSTYEIRYSTDPITNANYDSATIVQPMDYSGPDFESAPGPAVRTINMDFKTVWTRFQLPNADETSGQQLHFAIKDITVPGGNAGTAWPHDGTDGAAPPNSFIRTIDYVMP